MALPRENHYEAAMHRGVINVRWFTRELNVRWDTGWRLDRLIELATGDTLIVWERRFDDAEPTASAAGSAVVPGPAPRQTAPLAARPPGLPLRHQG